MEGKNFEQNDKNSINFKTVNEIGKYLVSEHINDEPFKSEKILISKEMVYHFLSGTGDENALHQTEDGAKQSVFAEKLGGKMVTPGFFTESLLANKENLWKALTIDESHEVINISSSTRWTAPIPVGSEVFFTFKIKKVNTMAGKPDADIKVDWSMVEFDTKAYYIAEDGKETLCMKNSYTVGYVPTKN